MGINYTDLLTRQGKARAEFRRVLREWRRLNGWRVWDLQKLAESKGFSLDTCGWGDLEHGIYGELSPIIFIGLGRLNEEPGIIAAANCNGSLWGPTEFWALYCGLQAAPWAWLHP